jgi:ABC-type branched-subunit amino acid transport system substrate-binding protein
MWKVGVIGAVGVLTLALAGAPPVSAQTGAGSASPEIGVTASTVRIGVVADVDVPLAPGLFQGVVDGVRGAVEYLNTKKGGGGIAGRKIAVDFLDSKFNPTLTRNAIITACGQDLALVGTATAFLTTFDDALGCQDQAGATTGLPDFAAAAGTIDGCAAISFPVLPPYVRCDTADSDPQTYQANRGAFAYLTKHAAAPLHGALLYSNATKALAVGGQAIIEGPLHGGVKSDLTTGIGASAQQNAFTPIVQQMKDHGSNFAFNAGAAATTIALMSEAQLQGLADPDFVWTCNASCYDESISSNASVTDDLYVTMTYVPFEEARQNEAVATFLKYVGRDKANGYSVFGWASALAFAQAARAAVSRSGADGLTRANVLEGAKTLTRFDAGGMLATTDIAAKLQSPCFALVQLRDGKWRRVFPAKRGTLDCTPSNHVEFKADLTGGG